MRNCLLYMLINYLHFYGPFPGGTPCTFDGFFTLVNVQWLRLNWLYNLWVSQWAWICVQVYLSSFLVCSWCLHQTWYRRCLRNAAPSIAFFSLHHAVCLCTSLKIRHNKIWACSINKLWFWKVEKDLLLRNVICGWWDMMRSNCTFLSIRILRKRYLIRSGPNMKPGSS